MKGKMRTKKDLDDSNGDGGDYDDEAESDHNNEERDNDDSSGGDMEFELANLLEGELEQIDS